MSIDTYGVGITYSNIDNISGADHGGLNGLADDDHTLYYHSGDAAELASLKLTTGITATIILDEDSMATDSATALASQQSIKSYSDIGSTPALQHIRSLPLFNSMSYDSFGTDITSDGATITVALAKQGGGNIVVQIDGVLLTYTAGGLALTPGTDTVPVKNYCWMYNNGGTATLDHNITGFPDGVTAHVKICTAVLPSATLSQTENVYSHQNMNQSIANQNSSHIEHISAWIRAQPSTWFSGVAQTLTITPNGGAPDAVIFSVASGITFQMHRHTFPALTSEYYIVNDSATLFDRILDLNGLLLDSAGASMSGKYFNLVIWGNQCSNDDSDDCKLYVNLPSGSYNTSTLAINDANNFSNFSIPNFFLSTGFLISRLTLRHQVASSGTWTSIEEADLRGTFPSQISGSVASSNIWQRNSTDISPINSGGVILIDEINEETTDAGVTIEGCQMIDGTIQLTTPVGAGPALYVRGDAVTGSAEIVLHKDDTPDTAEIRYSNGASVLWRVGTREASQSYSLYNENIDVEVYNADISFNKLNMTASLHVDVITELGVGNGCTIEDCLLKDGSVICANTGAGAGLTIDGNTTNGDAKLDIIKSDGTDDSAITFTTNATPRWAIDSLGSDNLQIHNLNTTNSTIFFGIADDLCTFAGDIKAVSTFTFDAGAGTTMSVLSDGTYGISTSLRKNKTNILNIESPVWLYKIEPKIFNRKKYNRAEGKQILTDEPESFSEYGLIADDVFELCPEICMYSDNENHSLENLKGIHMNQIAPLLIKLIQDQRKEINDLKTENQNQTNVIDNLLMSINGVSGIMAKILALETAMGMN